jgi:hypothetical protein
MPPASPRASVLSTAAERPEATSWSASIGAGFWRPWPHHVLERRLHYPEEAVSAREHAVVDERSAATIYRIWEQHFSRDKLEALLADADFEIEHFAACSLVARGCTSCQRERSTYWRRRSAASRA